MKDEDTDHYLCGVFMTKKGLRDFVVRRGKNPPLNIWEKVEVQGQAKAHRTADSILRSYSLSEKVQGRLLEEGDIAVHSDGDGVHSAIILRVKDSYYHALFFTTNPEWGSDGRPATLEEVAFAGFRSGRDTWLVPVRRQHSDFTYLTSLPSHRLEALQNEFPAIDFVP